MNIVLPGFPTSFAPETASGGFRQAPAGGGEAGGHGEKGGGHRAGSEARAGGGGGSGMAAGGGGDSTGGFGPEKGGFRSAFHAPSAEGGAPWPLAVYVHWPWCLAKCPYCDFNSHALNGQKPPETDYVGALLKELDLWQATLLEQARNGGPRFAVTSVYFGGGTPSLMDAQNIGRLLGQIGEKIGFAGGDLKQAEITLEANPTSSSKTHFKRLQEAGVNRLSLGVQGLKPEWLEFLGRKHRVEDALRTLDDALDVVGNVNADVIYGLPNQDLDEWEAQLARLAGMGLPHLSAYQLTVEPNTLFFRAVRAGDWAPIPDELEADFFHATRAVLTGHGYVNYETSNFAQHGRFCAHNLHVWQYGSYLGLGAGAHGRVATAPDTMLATEVTRHPRHYLTRMAGGTEAFCRYEHLTGPEAVQEALFLGLRTAAGVDLAGLEKRFGAEACAVAVDPGETRFLTEAGLLTISEGRLMLTDAGWPLLNGVLRRLFRPHAAR